MISADRAREIVDEFKEQNFEKQVLEIQKKIESSAKKGKRTCYIPYAVSKKAKEYIENAGYSVTVSNNRYDGFYTEIEW